MPECTVLPPEVSLPLLFTGIPALPWGGNVRTAHPFCPTLLLVSRIKQTKKSFASAFDSRRESKSGFWSRIPIFGGFSLICQLFLLKRQRCIFAPSGRSIWWISVEDPYPWHAPAGRRTVQPGMARHDQGHRGLPQLLAAPTGASMPPRRPQRGI